MKAAVIGCGRMGAFTSPTMRAHAPAAWFPLSHAEAVAAHPELQLTAFADHDIEAARRAAQAFGVAAAYDDPEAMLAAHSPALVTLATRTLGRAGLISLCVQAGVRALHVEKPLCNSMAEWYSLARLFDSDDVFASYGALRRHLPIYQSAMAVVASGRLGTLQEIRVQFGPGPLFWTQTHAIDLLLFAAGGRRLLAVQGQLGDTVMGRRPREVDNDPLLVLGALHFEGGLTGIISRAHGSDLVLSCEQGEIAVRADGGRADVYRCAPGSIYPTHSSLDLATLPGQGGTLAPISLLVDCLQHRPGASATNRALRDDMLLGQRVAFAMLQSHLQGGMRIAPHEVADDIVIHAKTAGRHA